MESRVWLACYGQPEKRPKNEMITRPDVSLCCVAAFFWPDIDALQQIALAKKPSHKPSLSPFGSDKAVDKLGTDAVIH